MRVCRGCGGSRELGRMVCEACWTQMPRELRRVVVHAEHALRRGGNEDHVRYRDVVLTVLDWCRERRAALAERQREIGVDVLGFKTTNDEMRNLREQGRELLSKRNAAVAIVERALIEHGAAGCPLVDALLDVRNALREPARA